MGVKQKIKNNLMEGVRKNKKFPYGKLKNGGTPCDIRKLPKCQAKSKSTGQRCKNIAMKLKKVCYLHGGKSPGAPLNNKNALTFGFYTKEAIEERKFIRKLMSNAEEFIKKLNNVS